MNKKDLEKSTQNRTMPEFSAIYDQRRDLIESGEWFEPGIVYTLDPGVLSMFGPDIELSTEYSDGRKVETTVNFNHLTIAKYVGPADDGFNQIFRINGQDRKVRGFRLHYLIPSDRYNH